jgi:hypothetical protein
MFNSTKLIIEMQRQRGIDEKTINPLCELFATEVDKLDPAIVDAAIAEFNTAAADDDLFDAFLNAKTPRAWDCLEEIGREIVGNEAKTWSNPRECNLFFEITPA